MKKLIKWAAASAAAALMISSLSFAQTPTTAPANSSGTVTPTSSDVSSAPAAGTTTTVPSSGSTTTVTPVGGTMSAPATSTTTVTPVGTTTVTPVSKTTVTVVKVKPVPGFKVCYHSMQRHVEGSRIVQRCGPYGCRDFRITRDFYVTVYRDCHIAKSCDGFRTYGWYPNKMEARDARDRCQHTVNGSVPNEWRITTW